MRKSKAPVHEDSEDETLFEEMGADQELDEDTDLPHDARRPRKPARQRVELRYEQQSLKRQLSDWDDYEQDDFDTKL